MIFDLVKDISDVLDAMPQEHPRHRILKLLNEAIRRDAHFIDRRPTTFFQCMWNTCWWYDNSEAAHHYEPPTEGWPDEGPPWKRAGPKLYELLEEWREETQQSRYWVRASNPPVQPLDSPQRAVLQRHTGGVSSVAFSPDGRHIVSGAGVSGARTYQGDDYIIRIWDSQSGGQITQIEGHTGPVNSVAFSPDGRRIVSGAGTYHHQCDDNTVRIWDALSGEQVAQIGKHTQPVRSVIFSPDGKRILSGSGRSICIWDAQSGEQIASLEGQRGNVNCVAFSPDGRRIVSGVGTSRADGRGNYVCIWDAESGEQIAILEGHRGNINCVAFSPDGRRIASGSEDDTIRIWDAVSVKHIARLKGERNRSFSVAFSPDGRRILSGGHRTIRIWDVQNGEQIACLEGHAGLVNSVTFSPDGRLIASGSEDKTVRIWDPQSGEQIARHDGHTDEINCVAFTPDGRHVLSNSYDNTIRTWDAQSGECTQIRRGSGDVGWVHTGAGAVSSPWRLLRHDLETVIESVSSGKPIAWFPIAFQDEVISTHPSGRKWAAANSNHLYIVELVGDMVDM